MNDASVFYAKETKDGRWRIYDRRDSKELGCYSDQAKVDAILLRLNSSYKMIDLVTGRD